MSLLLKVCGNCKPENTKETADLLPDMMGFIFYKPSPRCVGEFDMPKLPNSVQTAAVFVDEEPDQVKFIVKKYNFSWLQFSGHESPSYCQDAQKTARVIKAFHVDHDFDFEKTKPYLSCCDYFLFDAKGKSPGGNGIRFSWELLHNYPYEMPFFLSGGIGVGHLEEIKKLTHKSLAGLDVNSGVEASPGVKDLKKLNAFMAQMKTSEL